MIKLTTKPAHQQRGTALLVALVMIFMLSIMGISAMRGSTLERQMASNSIQAATTFQAAESSTEIALNNSINLTNAWMAQDPLTVEGSIDVAVDLQQNINMVHDVQLVFVGDGPAPNASMGVGSTNFMALRYESRGTASIDAVNSSSTVVQGAYRIVPAE